MTDIEIFGKVNNNTDLLLFSVYLASFRRKSTRIFLFSSETLIFGTILLLRLCSQLSSFGVLNQNNYNLKKLLSYLCLLTIWRFSETSSFSSFSASDSSFFSSSSSFTYFIFFFFVVFSFIFFFSISINISFFVVALISFTAEYFYKY